MCRPIRSLTEGRGFDVRTHRLAVFGGAGGQHACSIARNLGISDVVIHRYSSILSAYGMALAEVVHEGLEPSSDALTAASSSALKARLDAMQQNVRQELLDQDFKDSNLRFERYLNLRYQGTDTSLMIMEPEKGDFEQAFLDRHLREFTFTVPGRPILVDDLRVRGMATDGSEIQEPNLSTKLREARASAIPVESSRAKSTADVYFDDFGRLPTPVYMLGNLDVGSSVAVSILDISVILSPLTL